MPMVSDENERKLYRAVFTDGTAFGFANTDMEMAKDHAAMLARDFNKPLKAVKFIRWRHASDDLNGLGWAHW